MEAQVQVSLDVPVVWLWGTLKSDPIYQRAVSQSTPAHRGAQGLSGGALKPFTTI